MMIKKRMITIAVALGAILVSCSKDDGPAPTPEPPKGTLEFTFLDDLEDPGEKYQYEGWVVVDGEPKSTGTFRSTAAKQSFKVLKSDLDAATAFIISLEPIDDKTPEPSETKIIKGTFEGNTATINANEVIGDFSSSANVSGEFIMGAPTSDTPVEDAKSGIWFETAAGTAGLKLPTLNTGWVYEGWVIVEDNTNKVLPLSTGVFTDANASDNTSYYSGTGSNKDNAPNFPGEDFLQEPGIVDLQLNFPLDLRGKKVMISIEPKNDLESTIPFFLKPLSAIAPQDTSESTSMSFIRSIFPEGRAVRK